MRVAITSQHLDPKVVVSGISTVAASIIQHSSNQLFFYEVGYRDNENSKGIKWLFKTLKMILGFPFFLIRNKIDIVHINVPFDKKGIIREYILLMFAKITGRKVLLHIHGGKNLMIKIQGKSMLYIVSQILRRSDHVLVLSALEKEALANNYQFDNATYLLNAVDTGIYTPKDLNAPLPAKLRVLYLARITESKGIDDIADAFALLYPDMPFKFIVCGTGPDKDSFIDRCKVVMGNDIEYRGVLTGADKIAVINSSDIFILPSRHSEGLPMSLLETMAAGLVPVVTDEASMKFVVKPGVNGVRVNKYDSRDIYLKMKALMSNSAEIAKYSEMAKKTIEQDYDIKKYVGHIDELYREVLLK